MSRKPRLIRCVSSGGPDERPVVDAQRRQDHGRRRRDAPQPVGNESVEAVDAAEEQLAARALVPGPEVELGRLQAVAHPVARELACAGVEARQSVVGAQPEPALVVAADAVDDVARQAVSRGEGLEGLSVRGQVAQAAVRAHPEASRRVHEQRVDDVRGQAAGVSRPGLVANEPARPRVEQVDALLHRADPQAAVRRLGQARDLVAAQARGILRVEAVVREPPRLGIDRLQPAPVGAEPEPALAVLQDRGDAVRAEAVRALRVAAVVREDAGRGAEAVQARVERADPEVAAVVVPQGHDPIAAEAARLPRVVPVGRHRPPSCDPSRRGRRRRCRSTDARHGPRRTT